jgi:prepilin-type N-terminal cleavage/methylation domain-containing protein
MKKGFTLAEVLITLTIIGVVAALTIPGLVASYQEKVTVTQLKKVYTNFAQIYMMAQEENGPISTWCDGLPPQSPPCQQIGHDIITSYLKLSKDCAFAGGCFVNEPYKKLSGGNSNSYGGATLDWSTFILADGTAVLFQMWPPEDEWAGVYFDINGYKPPNQYGKDLFVVILTDKGAIPFGVVDKRGSELKNYCSTISDADACAAWVIYNENMDYLRCDDLSWNGKTKCN